jgi:hypothetical protein
MRLAGDIPHSKLRVLPGLGHMIHYFAQDEITASVEDLFGRTAQYGRGAIAGSPPAARGEARQAPGAVVSASAA